MRIFTLDDVAEQLMIWINDYIGFEPLSQWAFTAYRAVDWNAGEVGIMIAVWRWGWSVLARSG